MAEKTLKKVEEELNCSICLDTYVDPKLLQCLHTYCRKCLVKLVVQDQQGQLILTCPICRQDTPVPANGVTGLQPAFQINHLLEIMKEHKKAAADPPACIEEAERDSASLTSRERVKVCCCKHAGKEVELFCETCQEPICWKCALKGGKHYSHDYEELDKAFERYKVEVTASLEPMEKQVTTITKALAQLDARCAEISDQRAAVEADVHTAFEKLQRILDTRKTALIGRLHQITQRKLKELAVQRDQLETTLAQLSSCLGFMKESLKTGSQEEVLSMKSSVVKQVKGLTTTFPPDMLKPSTKANTIFSSLADVATACRNYGRVSTRDILSPVEKPHTPIITLCGFEGPRAVAINKRGEAIVVERSGHRFAVFNSCGEKLWTFGSRGSGQGQFLRPRKVTVDDKGNILVADGDNHRIQKFSPAAQFLAATGTRGKGPLHFDCTNAVSFNAANKKVYVSDDGNHNIQVLNSDLTFSSTFGKRGSGKGQFDHPRGIACDSTGKVYVADRDNHRIQVFTAEGKFLKTFGRYGDDKGELKKPMGVAIYSNDMVYISERNNHRVSIFTPEGEYVTSFGSRGEGPGQFDSPCAIAIDNSGLVYVCDYSNNRVQIF